ncbi:MAG: T9SS type A sorting domain-containing protein [Chitinophagales bacterium]
MKKLLFILICIPVFLTAQVTEDWAAPGFYYGLKGVMIARDAEDNVFTVSDIWQGDIYLSKHDKFGNELWSVTYNNTEPSQWEVATWLAVDAFGQPVVCGYTNTGFTSPYPFQWVVMKFNSNDGSLTWRNTFDALPDISTVNRAYNCIADSDGNIYVGGDATTYNATGILSGNFYLIKYAGDGSIIWETYKDFTGSPYGERPSILKFARDGNLLMTGQSSILYEIDAVKFDLSGNEIWSTHFPGFGSTDITSTADGFTYLMYSYSFGVPPINGDIAIKKIAPDGSLVWLNHYDNAGQQESSRKLEADNAGNLIFTGYTSPGGYTDWITFKTDNNGILLWSNVYDAMGNNDEWPNFMVLDQDDNIYITGQGGPWPGGPWASSYQMVTLKYSPSGNTEWVALHSEWSPNGIALCVASDNSIYAVGQGYAVTIHYQQTTPTPCNEPAGLFSNNISTTTAKLNWTIEPGVFQYEVWYKKVTAASWKIKFVQGTKNKLILKNLKCNTNYTWKIRTVCDTVGVDLVSDFSEDQFFTTALCREENYEVENEISIFPNPASDYITVAYTLPKGSTLLHISIYDSNGKALYQETRNVIDGVMEETINTENYLSGIYFVKIITDNSSQIQKLIINN